MSRFLTILRSTVMTFAILAVGLAWGGALVESAASVGQKTQNELLELYALLGDQDRSFAILESSFGGSPVLLSLAHSPVLEKLRADARCDAWRKRLGLKSR